MRILDFLLKSGANINVQDDHAKDREKVTTHEAEAQGLQLPAGHLGWHHSTALQCQPHLRPQQPSYLTQQGHSLCHRCPSPLLDWRSARSWTTGHSNPRPKNREHHPQVDPWPKNKEYHPQVCHLS